MNRIIMDIGKIVAAILVIAVIAGSIIIGSTLPKNDAIGIILALGTIPCAIAVWYNTMFICCIIEKLHEKKEKKKEWQEYIHEIMNR